MNEPNPNSEETEALIAALEKVRDGGAALMTAQATAQVARIRLRKEDAATLKTAAYAAALLSGRPVSASIVWRRALDHYVRYLTETMGNAAACHRERAAIKAARR